jgi:hypothetical protein
VRCVSMATADAPLVAVQVSARWPRVSPLMAKKSLRSRGDRVSVLPFCEMNYPG